MPREDEHEHESGLPGAMPDVAVADSAIHGIGAFATRPVRRGETALIIDDSRIVDETHPLRPELNEHAWHCDYLAGGAVVLMRAPERHINSSCDPNTFVKTIGVRRHVIALRDIPAGSEITYAYIVNTFGGAVWECHCGAPQCVGRVPSSFFELPVERQLEYLPQLEKWFRDEHPQEIRDLERHEGRRS